MLLIHEICIVNRKALEKLQEQAVEAQQQLEEAAEKEREAAAALETDEKELQKLRAEQERLKEVVEKDAQEAQASFFPHANLWSSCYCQSWI